MKEREQNLLIAATDIVGDFKTFGSVLQKSRAGGYDLQSSIGLLIASLAKYKPDEFTCEVIEESVGQVPLTIRYEIIWCETGHEDYHYKYFGGNKSDVQVNAFDYAKMLVMEKHTFHGCCGIHEQEARKYTDEHGPFVLWETGKKWECSSDVDGRCGFNLI